MRNRTSDLRILRSDAQPLSHRDSTVSGVYYEVHMTRLCLQIVSPRMKTLLMSRSLISEVRHTFYLLSFFISYLSGNKIRYLPQGIFKGLKQLLIVYVECEIHCVLNLIKVVSQYLLIIALISLRSTHAQNNAQKLYHSCFANCFLFIFFL